MRGALIPLTLLLGCSELDAPRSGDVWIAEVVTSNTDEERGDWVEIENLIDRRLDLAGMWISDAEDNPMKHQLSRRDPIVLPPRGRLLLLADGTVDLGPLHLPFKLSMKGETISISTRSGARIDQIAVPRIRSGQSYARTNGRLEICDTPTPEAANSCTARKPIADD